MAADIQEMFDRLAIRELVDRYSVAVTRRDWDAVADCFHEDARWRASVGYDFQGRETVRAGIRQVVERMEFLVQMTHACVVDELTADRARATSVLNEFGRRPNGQGGVFVLGVYTDTVTKAQGRWVFEERDFQVHYIDTAALPGRQMIDYANAR